MQTAKQRGNPNAGTRFNELIAAARMRFDALAAIGVLTQGQARSILYLLECDDATDRAFRDNIIRYLKKEEDFITVFAEMLQIDDNPAPPKSALRKTAKRWAFWAKGKRTTPAGARRQPRSTKSPPGLNAGSRARKAGQYLLSLPPAKAFFILAILAAGAIIPAAYVFTPGKESVAAHNGAGSVGLNADAGSDALSSAIFPSAISPEHEGETPYEAYLHTCYDQFKANRVINANGGLKWNQNGVGYYSECLKRLKP